MIAKRPRPLISSDMLLHGKRLASVAKQLGFRQQGFLAKHPHRKPDAHQPKPVHMIFRNPVFQDFHDSDRTDMRRKVKLHHDFNSVLMQRFYHILKLIYGIFGCGISILGQKIQPFLIAPVVDSLGQFFFPQDYGGKYGRRLLSGQSVGMEYFIKFIRRHQEYCCNAQFFQIRNLFHDSGISSFGMYAGRPVFRKSPYMKKIKNAFFKRNRQCPVVFPVKIMRRNFTAYRRFLAFTILSLVYKRARIRILKQFFTLIKQIRTVPVIISF